MDLGPHRHKAAPLGQLLRVKDGGLGMQPARGSHNSGCTLTPVFICPPISSVPEKYDCDDVSFSLDPKQIHVLSDAGLC